MMDFSKFRDTGELSDITVLVHDREFKLHKFPLFIKSDFFRALARSKITERDRVELADFPGGCETFEEVANYFYNIKVNITKANVCKLRCAAEFLQMTSAANLADVSDRFLHDTLTSAKLARNLLAIIDLLMQCCDLGPIAEQAGVVTKCIDSIVDCWLISSKFCRRDAQLDKNDLVILERLTQLPLDWFLQLFVTARDKAVRPAVLATLIELYINNALSKQVDSGEMVLEELLNEVDGALDDPKEVDKQEPEEAGEDGGIGEKEEQEDNEEIVAGEANDLETSENNIEPANTEKMKSEEMSKASPSDEDIGKVLDTLIQELPENTPLADTISPRWALKMLKMGDRLSSKSKTLLLKLVACLLHKFSAADLSQVSPDMLSEILAQAGERREGDPTQKDTHTNMACQVIDKYLLEQAKANELSVETFTKMTLAVPAEHRVSHDTLFETLELLIQSDKATQSKEELQKLLDLIDFERLSEATLQKAYDAQLVPESYVTKAALALCAKLRKQLEAAESINRSQQAELQKYGLGQKSPRLVRTYEARPYDSLGVSGSRTGGESVLRQYEEDDPYEYSHEDSETGSSSNKFTKRTPRRVTSNQLTTSTPTNTALTSLDPDLGLKLALDDLDREYRYGSSFDYGRNRYLDESRDSCRDSYGDLYSSSLYSRRPGHWSYSPKP